jgi:hypothetical protein
MIATLEDTKDFGSTVIMVVVITDSLTMVSQVIMGSLDSQDLIGNIERDPITQEDFLTVKKGE